MVTHLVGDCRDVLPTLAAGSAQCVVTSPPYWGLRDYGTASWEGGDLACDHAPERRGGRFATPVSAKQASNAGSGTASARDCPCGAERTDRQLGLEATPEEYLEAMVGVFRAVRRVLRADGTLWLNMGDSYASGTVGRQDAESLGEYDRRVGHAVGSLEARVARRATNGGASRPRPAERKPKDLVGMPWRLAFALQADGWFLRADIIWVKPNPMPESVTDRPTKAHEYVFLLTKSARYFYDADAVREPNADPVWTANALGERWRRQSDSKVDASRHDGARMANGRPHTFATTTGRNLRSVWTINSEPFPEAHFATFPTALASRCILAGSRMVDTVLDPFAGSGTVGAVAEQLGRHSILIELSRPYVAMARRRTAQIGLFTQERSA